MPCVLTTIPFRKEMRRDSGKWVKCEGMEGEDDRRRKWAKREGRRYVCN